MVWSRMKKGALICWLFFLFWKQLSDWASANGILVFPDHNDIEHTN